MAKYEDLGGGASPSPPCSPLGTIIMLYLDIFGNLGKMAKMY